MEYTKMINSEITTIGKFSIKKNSGKITIYMFRIWKNVIEIMKQQKRKIKV